MRRIEQANCRQCEEPFRFERKGKRPRIYCNVCRVLRYEAQVKQFKLKLSEADKRAEIRENAIKCFEAA